MKNWLVLILLFSACNSALPDDKQQVRSMIGGEDSALLHETWKTFLSAVKKKDAEKIRSLSFPVVDCINFSHIDSPHSKMPVDSFSAKLFRAEDSYFKKMFSGEYWFTEAAMYTEEGSLPGHIGDMKLFIVGFELLAPGEFSEEHEGAGASYLFGKSNGGFVFWGMYTIP